MNGSGVHYIRSTLALYTFCGYYVSAVKVTSAPGGVTCARCRREPGNRDRSGGQR